MSGIPAQHGSDGPRPSRQARFAVLALLLIAGILARALGMASSPPILRGLSSSSYAHAAGLAANATPIAPPPP
ncbi:MAG TPA: hypothetical protein VNL35_16930, partial [Chloroflexota bacterium]|nr:hypothetical protein [Chloroflexota bacterium]